MSWCPFKAYKSIFGQPGKGAHSYRILDAAAVDYVLTFVLAFIVSYFSAIPLTISTISMFVLSIIAHILFGVKTPTTEWLGVSCN